MRRLFPTLFLAIVVASTVRTSSAQTTQPADAQQIRKLLIISIDGCRPDLLLRGNCPRIRALCESGSFTFWAKTTAVSRTLPSHVSMLTGMVPEVHGVEWNDDLPLSQMVYPKVPTLFDLAKKRGYTTALVSGKSKMNVLDRPGSIDWAAVSKSPKCDDPEVASVPSAFSENIALT